MSVERWSPGRLVLVVVAWLLLSPILLFVVTRVLGGPLRVGVLRLVVLVGLWLGPPAWLVIQWRKSADRDRQ
jgi:hypothetical protein